MSRSVDYLLTEGLVDRGLADRLMHRGAWEPHTPPLPETGQKYVLGLFSGAMSLHNEYISHTTLACVTVDYQRSTPQKAAGEQPLPLHLPVHVTTTTPPSSVSGSMPASSTASLHEPLSESLQQESLPSDNLLASSYPAFLCLNAPMHLTVNCKAAQ